MVDLLGSQNTNLIAAFFNSKFVIARSTVYKVPYVPVQHTVEVTTFHLHFSTIAIRSGNSLSTVCCHRYVVRR